MNFPVIIRRVKGHSMMPHLLDGQIVIASPWLQLRTGRVVIVKHGGIEKVKRIREVTEYGIDLRGDNSDFSTDSRHFGLVTPEAIEGVVIYPV